jgi:integrase
VTKVLTQRAVEAAKPPKKGRTTRADGIVPGMRFIVHAGGKKSARLLARIHGKQENLEVGDLSLITLADARAKAKGMLAMINNGEDPRTAKREAIKAASETVEVAARRFIERHAKAHNRTWKETEQRIEREILPHWGKRPLASIEQSDVVALLDAIVDRGGAGISANRTLAQGRKFFNWCRERGLIKVSPFDHVRPPVPEVKRDRVHTIPELALILLATDQLGYPFGPFIKAAVLLGQRREEIAGMRWSELDVELTLWTLPAARAKNGVQHHVPIVPQVRSILVGLPHIGNSDFVFTSTGNTSISGYSKAKAALDSAITELNGGVPIPPWRLHDLRRSMASHMARLGVQLPVVEKLLNHVSGTFGGVAGIYQRHSFSDKKRQRWNSGRNTCSRSPKSSAAPSPTGAPPMSPGLNRHDAADILCCHCGARRVARGRAGTPARRGCDGVPRRPLQQGLPTDPQQGRSHPSPMVEDGARHQSSGRPRLVPALLHRRLHHPHPRHRNRARGRSGGVSVAG